MFERSQLLETLGDLQRSSLQLGKSLQKTGAIHIQAEVEKSGPTQRAAKRNRRARKIEGQPVPVDHDLDADLNPNEKITQRSGTLFLGSRPLPPLPQKMSPSQAARLAELLDFLHRHLTAATENIKANDDGTQVTLSYADWQRVLAVQMLLARYVRAVAEPDILNE